MRKVQRLGESRRVQADPKYPALLFDIRWLTCHTWKVYSKETIMRFCNTCQRELPLEQFPLKRKGFPQRHYKCKECAAEYQRQYRKRPAAAEVHRQEEKDRYSRLKQDPEWAEQERRRCRAAQKRSYVKHKDRAKSRKRVRTAIENGSLPHPTTQNCKLCSNPAEEYHHTDYSKPLDVMPLCCACHDKKHRIR